MCVFFIHVFLFYCSYRGTKSEKTAPHMRGAEQECGFLNIHLLVNRFCNVYRLLAVSIGEELVEFVEVIGDLISPF